MRNDSCAILNLLFGAGKGALVPDERTFDNFGVKIPLGVGAVGLADMAPTGVPAAKRMLN
jgi:hypothetical protein